MHGVRRMKSAEASEYPENAGCFAMQIRHNPGVGRSPPFVGAAVS
jgi:hypothetical protein